MGQWMEFRFGGGNAVNLSGANANPGGRGHAAKLRCIEARRKKRGELQLHSVSRHARALQSFGMTQKSLNYASAYGRPPLKRLRQYITNAVSNMGS